MNWPEAMIGTLSALAVFAVVAVLIWQVFQTAQTSIRAKQSEALNEAYRTLASEVTASQQRTAAALAETAEALGELRARVGAIEKLLREVE